ncbi:Tyrosine-protein phosphatase non-receptor type 21 [Acropora cervicornis]|uniref:Tyrosine-protein phosphatase non-receptor type 21 n=1 Tax=Acropora cervicornis TaxID=6130 RepID=A0AAD9PYY1_ACRCE|nr:Tyrosine-protein phosphatase non-receptor type 21 [Acropora cervicornis]
MPFGICGKPSKDYLAKEILAVVEIPGKTFVELKLGKDASGFECVRKIAKQIGLVEIGYFGLCYRNKKGHEWWLILEKPIRKQLDKHAASGPHNINLKLKIQFFVTDSCWIKLQDEVIRNLYYLQLRNEFAEGSLSSELGDYNAEMYASYIEDETYFPFMSFMNYPKETLEQECYCVVCNIQHLKGMTSEEAKLKFITITQKLDGFGDEYHPAKDNDGRRILVGASSLGIIVRHPHGLPPAYFRKIPPQPSMLGECLLLTINFIECPAQKCQRHCNRVLIHLPKKHSSRKMERLLLAVTELPQNAQARFSKAFSARGKAEKRGDGFYLHQLFGDGLLNPVFDEEGQSLSEGKDTVDNLSQVSVSSFKPIPSALHRPQSLKLASGNSKPGFGMHNNLCTSENSLHRSRGLYSNELLQNGVTNEVGSSISMDSGNPPGAQSLESLSERIHPGSRNMSPEETFSASTPPTRTLQQPAQRLEKMLRKTDTKM